MTLHGRLIRVAAAGLLVAARAEATTDFTDAAVHRHGVEQVGFLREFVTAKQAQKDAPAKSLVASVLAAQGKDSRPPLDFAALARDEALSASLLLDYAEALYATEQFDAAAGALGLMSTASQQANAARFDALKLKLALRGVGKLGRTSAPDGADPTDSLNQALAALRVGDRPAAIKQLDKLRQSSQLAPEYRHRAALWLAVLFAEQGGQADVMKMLDAVDGGSPLLADALLTTIRVFSDVQPSAASAIERQLAIAVPDSPARWEARDYLVRALVEKGATAQAGEQALSAIGTLKESIARLDKLADGARTMPVAELRAMVDGLSDVARARANELLRREATLRQAVEVLRAWRPHVDAYQTRLQRNPAQFAAEVRTATESMKEAMQRESDKGDAQASLFQLELSGLVGSPPNRDIAYRLFFGFAQWELGYEYPEDWRPGFDRPVEDVSGKRRRVRDAAQQRERLDQKMVPLALGHVAKLRGKVDAQLGKQASAVFKGMAERAKELSARQQARIGEIERLLPELTAAVRAEVLQGLAERRRIAQQWLARFAAHAVTTYVAHKATGEQPDFDLNRPLAAAPGQGIPRTIQALALPPKKRVAGEINVLPVWQLLKTLAASGENRQVRADALRLRAQLSVALYEAQAIPSTAEAMEDYRLLLRDYADLVDPAEVVYQLARVEDLGQRINDSFATLTRFAREFPASPRTGEVLFRIGEIQFSLGEFPAAQAAYKSVIARGDSRYRDQAEYKLAWSLFKMGEYRDALPRFLAVLDRAGDGVREDDGRHKERLKDTFRAVALTFAYMNGAADVERYFARVGQRSYVPDIYYNLALYYLEHERINDATGVYESLVKSAPLDARAPALLAEVIAGARKEKLNKLALDLQDRFIEGYGTSGAYWQQAPAAVRSQINRNIQPMLAEFGQMYHADAQQERKPESYARAIKYYRQYVETFPDDKATPGMHFLLAEARFETGDLDNAVRDYEKLAYGYGAHEKAAESGYALLVATQKQIEQESDGGARKAKLSTLVGRSAKFAETFPGDRRVESVLVKASEDILAVGDAREAVRLSEMLLARNPAEAVRRRASQVLAHGAFESGDFAKAEAAYVRALAFREVQPSDAAEMTERLSLSVYRQAEGQLAAGNEKAAIDTFLRVGKVAPGTEAVPNSVIEASVLLAKAKRWPEVIDLLEAFPKRFPGHKLNDTVPLRLAVAYENDGRFLLAADMLERMSQGERDDPLARQMLWRAAELREKGGRTDLAVATYERYLKLYPQPVDKATELRQLLADIAAKANDLPKRDRWLDELIAVAKTPEGMESVRVRYLAAQAAMVFGDDSATLFGQIKLNLPLDKSLADKRKWMESALRWYEQAGRFGVQEVTTIATYKTGEIYRDLARDILASERPPGLSELELGQYNVLLDEQAAPMDEKASEIHEINYGRIAKGVYDEWVKKSLVSLRSLFASKYDKVEVRVGPFAYVAPQPVVSARPPASPNAAPGGKPAAETGVPASTVDAAASLPPAVTSSAGAAVPDGPAPGAAVPAPGEAKGQ